MQSGSIKACLAKFLNRPLSFKSVYYFLLKRLTGLNVLVQNGNIDYFKYKIHTSEEFVPQKPSLKELNPVYVLVREKVIDYNININNLEMGLKFDLPNIQYMTPIENTIRWKNSNLQSISIARKFPLDIEPNCQNIDTDSIMTGRPNISSFARDEIRLAEKVRVVEEIITLSPYVKQPEKDILFKAPIIKKPLFKSYFTEEEMDILRDTLAKQNKTKKQNVKITNIYDKFNIDLFSSIKQEPATKNLMCYLNSKPSLFNKEKLYYLVIGQRNDNRITIKSLARLDKN